MLHWYVGAIPTMLHKAQPIPAGLCALCSMIEMALTYQCTEEHKRVRADAMLVPLFSVAGNTKFLMPSKRFVVPPTTLNKDSVEEVYQLLVRSSWYTS